MKRLEQLKMPKTAVNEKMKTLLKTFKVKDVDG
jgi:hypothetical protein